ncbi:LysR family transcriptional regulator, partial [Calderihabitans maritimus]
IWILCLIRQNRYRLLPFLFG